MTRTRVKIKIEINVVWNWIELHQKSQVVGIGTRNRYTIQGPSSESMCMKHIVSQRDMIYRFSICDNGKDGSAGGS